MIKAILQIAAILLKIVDRHLEERAANERLIDNEKFKQAIADGNLDFAAYILGRRLQSIKDCRAKGQGADIPPPDKS